MRAFQHLFPLANTYLARRIEQADLRLPYIDYFKQAIDNRDIAGDRFFVHLEDVETPDILVLVADFFLRVNTVTWSIVSGVYEDRIVIIFRNDGLRRDAGKVAARAFVRFGTAGGHKSMARAEFLLNEIATQVDINRPDKLGSWIKERVDRLLVKTT
ncbi:MAG: DHH family phosphoesterase [Deltaproteobacteria bacterium]|nr:DHH family phosphoesterase [Deltaproteobacteria bacterium]